MKLYRHGDVDFREVSEEEFKALAAKAKGKKAKQDSFVVALGEVTGHKHVMTMERPATLEIVDLLDHGIERLFHLGSAGTMTHEEHHPITMAPGFYVQKIERDFDPFSEEARRALD